MNGKSKVIDKEIAKLLATKELGESEIGKTITYDEWVKSRENKTEAYLKAMDLMQVKEDNFIIPLVGE